MMGKISFNAHNRNSAWVRNIWVKITWMLFVCCILFLGGTKAMANNIQIKNVKLTGQDTGVHYTMIQFDISWDNSWRDAVGPKWDGAYVFAKWKHTGSTDWNHCTLSTSDTDHMAPEGSQIDASFSKNNYGKGALIYRDSDGTGSTNWDNVQLRWNYNSDGVEDDDKIDIKVFVIEMVLITTSQFLVGDFDNDQTNCFHDGDDAGPYLINSEAEITVGSGNGELYYDQDNSAAGDQSGPIPATFPKGRDGIHCMKYEISQGQYTEFLNSLTRNQQNTRTGTDVSTDAITNIYVMSNSASMSYRNTITCPSSGNGTTDPITFSCSTPDRACNYLSWMDGCAYADWAGLRPMTELEFEKICRDGVYPIDDEYAWGNATIASSAYTLSNDGQPNESIAANYASDPNGNASYNTTDGPSINGPLRCGIFATSTSTRAEAGASYFGVMEMGGNLYEKVVTVGNATGRSFGGSHGNGALSTNGNADRSDWPGYSSGEVTGATGSGFRGGSWVSSASALRISDRASAALAAEGRSYSGGFRAVRTY